MWDTLPCSEFVLPSICQLCLNKAGKNKYNRTCSASGNTASFLQLEKAHQNADTWKQYLYEDNGICSHFLKKKRKRNLGFYMNYFVINDKVSISFWLRHVLLGWYFSVLIRVCRKQHYLSEENLLKFCESRESLWVGRPFAMIQIGFCFYGSQPVGLWNTQRPYKSPDILVSETAPHSTIGLVMFVYFLFPKGITF